MLAVPAIDLMNGACAHRAAQGLASSDLARDWDRLGFRRLHVRSLDCADSHSASDIAVERLAHDTSAEISVGGEVESADRIELLHALGASRVVVGRRALDEIEWLAGVAGAYPSLLIVETEVRNRRVTRRGWVRTLPVDILDFVSELAAFPLAGLLVTSVPLDAGERSTSLALLEDLVESSPFPIIVSAASGLGSLDDLHALEHRGIAEVVLAGELLDGSLDPRSVAQAFGG